MRSWLIQLRLKATCSEEESKCDHRVSLTYSGSCADGFAAFVLARVALLGNIEAHWEHIMVHMRYCLLAEAANYSGGKVNALGIFNHLFITEELPGRVPRFSLVFCLQGEEEDEAGALVLEGGLWSPQGQRLMGLGDEFHVTSDMPGELPGATFVSDVDQLVIKEEGMHVLRFRWGNGVLPPDYQFEMSLPVTRQRDASATTSSSEVNP